MNSSRILHHPKSDVPLCIDHENRVLHQILYFLSKFLLTNRDVQNNEKQVNHKSIKPFYIQYQRRHHKE